MGVGEVDLPLVATDLACRGVAADPVAHVIVDLAVVDPGAKVAVDTIVRAGPLAGDHVRFLADQMVDRDAVERRRRIGDVR